MAKVTRKREVALRLLRGERWNFCRGSWAWRFSAEPSIAGIDASLKERKGDQRRNWTSPHRGVMQPGGPETFGGGRARHLSRHGFGLASSLCGLSSFYAMKSRQQATAERPPAKRRGPKPSIGRGSAGGHRGRPGGIPLGGRSGLGFGSVVASVFPARGAPGDARQPALAPSLPPPWRKSPCPSPMPPARVFTVDDAGAGYSPPSSIAPSASAGMCARLRRPSGSPWGLRGCMPRPPPVRRGGWPCGWITAPILSDHFTNQIKFWGIQPSYNSPRGVAERFRTLQSVPHLRRSCGGPQVRRTVQCPVDRGEERLPEPRSSSSGVAHRDVTQARRMRQTCVQGTGYDTKYDTLVKYPP